MTIIKKLKKSKWFTPPIILGIMGIIVFAGRIIPLIKWINGNKPAAIDWFTYLKIDWFVIVFFILLFAYLFILSYRRFSS